MARKIIQIVTAPDSPMTHLALVVLCDDGTVWWRRFDAEAWHEVAGVPQPDPAPGSIEYRV
jgi:hypothetical protein